MSSPVYTERKGSLIIIMADNPPVNALSAAVREGILSALENARSDDGIAAVILACAGKTFFAGADINEFGSAAAAPLPEKLIEAIEAFDKPVIAAVHGSALGGGCETAMACHHRIAVPTAKFGLPEVKLGIMPGAGGTQRLPRLVGMKLALEMIVKGEPIAADQAKVAGLIDRIADEDRLISDAMHFANEIAAVRPLPRASMKPLQAGPDVFAAFRKANARLFRGFEAPGAIVDVLERSAGMTFDAGSELEFDAFSKLLASRQSAALRHIFFAERKAAKIAGLAEGTEPRAVKHIGVIGAGTMGRGIAINFLSAGMPVTLVEMAREPLDRGAEAIRSHYETAVAKGRMSDETARQAIGFLQPSLDFEALAQCDLIIEAVYEDMEVKKEIFGRLDRLARPETILATNTSYLNIDEIASVTSRPHNVVGMHFFSPANIMKLLEVVRGARTADDVLATVMTLARKIQKVAVVSGVCHGFIGNRMLQPRQDQAMNLLLEGATPRQIDKVHVDFGMPIGPFQIIDLAGVDIGWHRDPTRIDTIIEALAAEGRWGQKTGAGFYDYDEKRNASPSPRVEEIVAQFRQQAGKAQRAVTEQEIVERSLYTMINEGALILQEGIAQRASDIDLVWVHGYGWPAYRGGPMFWAETEGLKKIVAGLDRHGFSVAPLLRELAACGKGFGA